MKHCPSGRGRVQLPHDGADRKSFSLTGSQRVCALVIGRQAHVGAVDSHLSARRAVSRLVSSFDCCFLLLLLSVDPLHLHTTRGTPVARRDDTIVLLLYVLRMWSCPLYRARSLATAVRSRAVCQVACVWSPWSAVRRVAYGTGFYLLLLLLLLRPQG